MSTFLDFFGAAVGIALGVIGALLLISLMLFLLGASIVVIGKRLDRRAARKRREVSQARVRAAHDARLAHSREVT